MGSSTRSPRRRGAARECALAVLCGLTAPGLLPAQAARRVEVQVTAVSGGSAYLDKGRDAGIEPGDSVVLRPPGQASVQATVRVVSRTSCRAELPAGASLPGTGIRGEVLVPEHRAGAAAPEPGQGDGESQGQAAGQATAPDHPPWQEPVGEWNGDDPLLAPAFGLGPAARPTRLHGRVWAQGYNIWNRTNDSRRYLFAQLGTDLLLENPVHLGGRLHLLADVSRRLADVNDGTDESSTTGILHRFSYLWGDTPDEPVRFELGRFLQSTPELGVIDGIEGNVRVGSTSRIGGSVGSLLEPYSDPNSGDSVQGALSYGYASEDGDLVAGLAYQKTWYRGDEDRDLLFGDLFWLPVEGMNVHSSIWVDYYTSDDVIKSSGFEITQFQLQGNYVFAPTNGVGISMQYVRWPELLRNEFQFQSPDLIRDSQVFRISGYTWNQLSETLRLDARIDYWDDQDGHGTSGDIGIGLRDLLFEQGSIGLNVFHNDGSYTEGNGFRISGYQFIDPMVQLSLSYEWARYEAETSFAGGTVTTLNEQALTGSANFMLAPQTDLSVFLDYRFGDSQDAFTLGFFVQTRF